LLLKSVKELVSDPQYSGELMIKGGQLTVVQQKQSPINNIHVWTSAFIIYMGVMLEKWPNKGHEYLKYMYSVRLAAERGFGTGWVTYDEQFRLRKSRSPTSAWGDVDIELWLIYVATHEKPKLTVGQTFNNPYYDFQKEGPIMGTDLKAADFVPVGDSTGDIVSLGEIAGLHTNTQLVLDPIHKQNAESDLSDDTRLYQLAKSPKRFYKVEESLINYPRKYEAIELIEGLKHGFPLQYSGTRLPFNTKNLRSVYERPD
jgi:hypothetical protein